jgi:hypothetical protein
VICDFDDASSREKLYVTFVSRETYVNDGAPRQTIERFAAAASKNAFFRQKHRRSLRPCGGGDLACCGAPLKPTPYCSGASSIGS